MDPSLPVAPLESFYPDPDHMLRDVCELCGHMLDLCTCVLATPVHRAPTFTADTFLGHPEWPHSQPIFEASPEPESFESEPALLPPIDFSDGQSLYDFVQQLNDNATSMLPSTVQIHVESTYTPGDRLVSQAEGRRHPHRRQAPRPGGFPCSHDGCGKAFDRSCDLKRHQKTHLTRYERPHKCSICNEGFLYPKDRNRHQRTHDQSAASQAIYHCDFPGCSNVEGFSRRDNLLRHQRKQHPRPTPPSWSRSVVAMA